MEKGDILICKKNVKNYVGKQIFTKDQECEILDVKKNEICIEVVINGRSHKDTYFPIDWINDHFDLKNSDE